MRRLSSHLYLQSLAEKYFMPIIYVVFNNISKELAVQNIFVFSNFLCLIFLVLTPEIPRSQVDALYATIKHCRGISYRRFRVIYYRIIIIIHTHDFLYEPQISDLKHEDFVYRYMGVRFYYSDLCVVIKEN